MVFFNLKRAQRYTHYEVFVDEKFAHIACTIRLLHPHFGKVYLQIVNCFTCWPLKTSSMLRPGRPRHEQLSDWLREQIEKGRYKPDDRLPSEHELSERFGVSRITVRRALQTLEHEGLIYRRQGLGSFVQNPKIHQGLVRLTDFAEDMARAGLQARSEILHFAPEPASTEVAAHLEIPAGQLVVRLDRRRLGNEEPIAFDRTWMSPFYAQFLEGRNLEQETIYGILESLDIPVVRGRYRIEAVNAEAAIAHYLEVAAGTALLRIDRVSYTVGGKVVYYQQRFYRSDRVAYELVLERDSRRRIPPTEGMPLREFEPIFRKGQAARTDQSATSNSRH